MYATCLFCRSDLGRNDSVERFPVGTRLAFDAAKGRLWVVCRRCTRWNLSPLEERWEAIEACERLYRDTRLRVSTANIGLARLRDGTELVRIGRPELPEFAAWRYGRQLRRRHRRHLLLGGVAAVLSAGTVALWTVLSSMAVPSFNEPWVLTRKDLGGRPDPDQIRLRVPAGDGRVLLLDGWHLYAARLLPRGDSWTLEVPHLTGRRVLDGHAATQALALMLPYLNPAGGSSRSVRRAVAAIEEAGSPERFVTSLESRAGAWGGGHRTLPGVPAELRLALEMAANEESERRALHGELALLEAAWREAEGIAAIADRLPDAPELDARLERLRGDPERP